MTEEERKAFRMYGKLPAKGGLVKKFQEPRKYFDSGDYAMQKAGKNSEPVGKQHPKPEEIPHVNPALCRRPSEVDPAALSPKMESHLLHDATSELMAEAAASVANDKQVTA